VGAGAAYVELLPAIAAAGMLTPMIRVVTAHSVSERFKSLFRVFLSAARLRKDTRLLIDTVAS
jgi:hypothetical protein